MAPASQVGQVDGEAQAADGAGAGAIPAGGSEGR